VATTGDGVNDAPALKGIDEARAVTLSFLSLVLAQLWHVFNMRDRGTHLIRNDITRNPYVWGALALCVAR
jgi:Ca2+-transporting ATPase